MNGLWDPWWYVVLAYGITVIVMLFVLQLLLEGGL